MLVMATAAWAVWITETHIALPPAPLRRGFFFVGLQPARFVAAARQRVPDLNETMALAAVGFLRHSPRGSAVGADADSAAKALLPKHNRDLPGAPAWRLLGCVNGVPAPCQTAFHQADFRATPPGFCRLP